MDKPAEDFLAIGEKARLKIFKGRPREPIWLRSKIIRSGVRLQRQRAWRGRLGQTTLLR